MAKRTELHTMEGNSGRRTAAIPSRDGASLRGHINRKEPMAKRSIAERLAQLDAQRKTLQSKLGKQERAKDTRRKVLLGAFVLYRLEKGQDEFSKHLGDWLNKELPGFLTREDDKALFDELLQQLQEEKAESRTEDGKAAP